MADFTYTNFKNSPVTLSNLPDAFFNCENYLIIKHTTGADTYIIYFEEKIEWSNNGTQHAFASDNNDSFANCYRLIPSTGVWQEQIQSSLGTKFYIDGCSDSLLQYKDLISTKNFSIDLTPQEVIMYTLKPIVEEINEKEHFADSVFLEVFSILPVLMSVLVGFIGIRKGINYLFSLLRKS